MIKIHIANFAQWKTLELLIISAVMASSGNAIYF